MLLDLPDVLYVSNVQRCLLHVKNGTNAPSVSAASAHSVVGVLLPQKHSRVVRFYRNVRVMHDEKDLSIVLLDMPDGNSHGRLVEFLPEFQLFSELLRRIRDI